MKKMTSIQAINNVIGLFSTKANWIKGDSYKQKTVGKKTIDCYCLSGAVNQVGGGKKSILLDSMARAIAIYNGKQNSSSYSVSAVVSFNDRRSTTFDDITAVLRITRGLLQASGGRALKSVS